MLNTSRLAIKWLWREIRAKEWYLVFFALLLSVTAVTTLHFYTDRLIRGIDQQSTKFLGGDLVVSSPVPFPANWTQRAHALGLRTAEVWSYPSMINAKDKMQFVTIQAVSTTYPLLSDQFSRPAPQTAWIEPRLLPLLSLHLNDTIRLGAANFQVTRLLTSDIDTLNTGWIIAPYVMIPLSAVPATKTVLPGSRVDYRLLLVGETSNIKVFKTWILPQLTPGQRLLDVNNQRLPLRDIVARMDHYLQLILLVCLTMSGVAIALSTQQYLRKHTAVIALWRCLGAQEQQISHLFAMQLLMIALSAGALGTLLGYLSQGVLAALFSEFINFPLPAITLSPIWLGFTISSFLLFAYAYPIVTQLPKTSPLIIWREEATGGSLKYQNRYLIITLILLLLIVLLSTGFSLLTLFFMDALLLTAGFLYAIHQILLALLRFSLNRTTGTVHRGFSQIVQHPDLTGIQFAGFTFVLMSLFILGSIKNDLIYHWQQSLPATTPNYFAFNIAPTDLSAIKTVFAENNIPLQGIYPMIRARLTELNHQPIMSAVPPTARNHNALHRELNLSWMWHFPADNKITQGRAWVKSDGGKALASVEQEVAESLHLKLGDQLTFQLADKPFSATIVSVRQVDWTSFHPNFYIIFPPGLIEQVAATTYITSFYLPGNKTTFINQLSAKFPNMTVLDVANLLNQIQTILNKIYQAMEYLFLFSLGIGVLIFIASVQASLEERKQTYRLLRVLGASRHYIIKSLAVEFITLAVLIMVTAWFFGKVIAWAMLKYIF